MERGGVAMEAVLKQAEMALDAGLYYAALVVCVTIPDIGAALSSASAETDPDSYKKWFSDNVASHLDVDQFTGKECWNFRNAILHEGRTNHKSSGLWDVVFVAPNPIQIHGLTTGGILTIQL